MKIVINNDFGGFGLSDLAFERWLELSGIEFERCVKNGDIQFWRKGKADSKEADTYLWYGMVKRNDPNLVRVVEELGDKANGSGASLTIVEVPDNVKWEISEYDGNEHVAEKHRKWY